jgi:serine protease Do
VSLSEFEERETRMSQRHMILYPACCLGFMFFLVGCITPSTLLINDQGQIYRCSSYGAGGLGMAMASGIHSTCVNDMKKLGYVPLPPVRVGVELAPGTKRVTKILPNSGAARAGIQVDDEIIAVDGRPLGSVTDQARFLATKHEGDVVTITIERAGTRQSLPVPLSPWDSK